MRLSADNHWLFTAGNDGCLIIHEIKDRDTKGLQQSRAREIGSTMAFSEEVLTEKIEMEDYIARKDQLNNELVGARDSQHSGVNEKVGANEYEEKIQKLQEELDSNKLQTRNKIE